MSWTADYHMHTHHSPDSSTTIVEMYAKARRRGLSEIAVTNHFEFFPDGKPHGYTLEIFNAYKEELSAFRQSCPNTIPVRFGVEMGQPFENPSYAEELTGAFQFDFILGSVHNLNDIDLYTADYTDENVSWFCRTYLEALYQLADETDFDCLAHLDLVKRYAAFRGIHVDLTDYPDELTAVLKRVIERGKGIEINTSGIRQRVGEMLPGLSILSLYKQLGGKILTIGSDAHNIHDVAADLEAGYDLARKAGFTSVCSYEGRKPSFHSIEEEC